ncbi:MAG TPA: hypothetical protein EYP10_14310, partial [Armatimonadetes bacterium]|nr:hypothetical protein [Armatimonadota bacterium]
MSHRPIFKSHDLAQRIFDQRRISRNGISIRAVLMSLSLTALLALTAPYVQLVLRGSSLTASRMPVGALAIYFLLIAILNPLIARIASRYAFTRKELALIYLCMLVSVTLATNGCALYLFSVITAPIYYASPANNWAELFWSYIPSWLTVWDQETIRDFYHGIPMGEHLPWRAWQIPLIAWFAFTVAWLIAYVCLGALLSYRWIREEKLLFPLACVPVDMLGEQQHPRLSSHFFRNGIMWLGFAIPFIIHSINAMSYHIPSFPRWQLSGHNIGRAFTNPPWNAAAELQIGIHFAVIGIGFIISADVGLGFWSFYLLSVLQRVALHALGIGARAIGSVTAATCILRGEEIGAFTLLSGTYLWALRGISRYRLSRDGYSLDITSVRCMLIGLSIAVCVI